MRSPDVRQYNFRAPAQLAEKIEALRRKGDPIPTIQEVIARAIENEYARVIRPRKSGNGGEHP